MYEKSLSKLTNVFQRWDKVCKRMQKYAKKIPKFEKRDKILIPKYEKYSVVFKSRKKCANP